MEDQLLYCNLESDIALMKRTIDMIAPPELMSIEGLRYFVGRSVAHCNRSMNKSENVNHVMNKIQDATRAYYYLEEDNSEIETRIMNCWIQLTETIQAVVERYIYDRDDRLDIVAALKSFGTQGMLVVILSVQDDQM